MKSSLTKKELRVIDTEDLKRLKKEIEQELSKRKKTEKRKLGSGNNPSKNHLYTTIFTDDERARYRRVGYDPNRY